MAGQLLTTAQIVFVLLSIIGIIAGFYKVITDKAKLESDLRNEIENLQDDNQQMNQQFEKLTLKFDTVIQQLGKINEHDNRIQIIEKSFDKIDRKMDSFFDNLTRARENFSDGLNKLGLGLAGKQDRPI